MISPRIVKCKFCNTTILMRFQMGYFDIPFDFVCPNCGVHINGTQNTVQNQDIEIYNASIIETKEPVADYYLNLSVELPSRKICKYTSYDKIIREGFSPFLMASQLYGDNYESITRNISLFLNFKREFWPKIIPLYDLFFNGKIELMKPQLQIYSKAYNIINKLDAKMSLHQLLVKMFFTILPPDSLNEFTDTSKKINEEKMLFKAIELIYKVGGEDFFDKNAKRIIKIFNRWVELFEKFIPVIMLSLGNVKNKIDKNSFGISTTNLDECLNFYSDSYEIITDLVDLVVGLNNISIRGTLDDFPSNATVKNFDNYRRSTKANKIKCIADNETFSKPMHIDKDIRNAIAHYDYEFNSTTQEIIFRDNFNGKEKLIKVYLVDFACLCYDNVTTLFYLNEIMYNLQKILYTLKGMRPNINPALF